MEYYETNMKRPALAFAYVNLTTHSYYGLDGERQ